MSGSESLNGVLAAIEVARASGAWFELDSYSAGPDANCNEALVFLKPELTSKLPADTRSLDVVLDALDRFGCDRVSTHVIGVPYLARHRLIEKHYGLINRYSEGGFGALPAEAQRMAATVLASQDSLDERVLGAHQVLEVYPGVTAAELLMWHDEATDTIRLGSGAYAFEKDLGNGTVLIIDGFHPAQLDHFYNRADPILVFVVRSKEPWVDLREKMCGATNPLVALPGSIRNVLFQRADEFSLVDFDAMRNGVHVSAGPVESAVEVARYLSDLDSSSMLDFVETTFGRGLAQRTSLEFAGLVEANAVLPGADASSFDLTEHVDSLVALDQLSELWRSGS